MTKETTATPTAERSHYTHCIECGKKLPPGNRQEKNEKLLSRSREIGTIDVEVRFCTLRCAAAFGVDTARGWERYGVELKHAAQREAEAAGKAAQSTAQRALESITTKGDNP
jgi:hypothetical protein